MTKRIAINGFGRIGRSFLRSFYERGWQQRFSIALVNEPAPSEAMAHLLKYDSSHGRFQFPVELSGDNLTVAGDLIRLSHETEIEQVDWRAQGIDIVVDCTGVFGSHADGERYLDAGVSRVLFSQPGTPDMDATIIFGVNQEVLLPEHRIVSNGSCTTNCIVPVIKLLDDAFGIESGAVTTIHSAMHDQQVIDAYHPDLRRTRAAGRSIIPVDTKLARGIERILPHLHGRFEAIAVRVPTTNVTAMDLSVTLQADVTGEEVNRLIQQAASNGLRSILDYTEEPLVSIDFNHDPHSCIVDGTQTRVSHHRLVKLLCWCDNEWGFANRLLETTELMTQQ